MQPRLRYRAEQGICDGNPGLANHRQHPVDLRGTVGIWRWRYSFVVLAGRQRRRLSRLEYEISRWVAASAVGISLFVSILTGLLVLYLLKSALGIDILPNTSLGIWDWFKRHVF